MSSEATPAGSSTQTATATLAGLSARALYNLFYGVMAFAGAFVMAYPIENVLGLKEHAVWYPSLLGVSLMTFAVVALLLVNTTGTIGEKVSKLRMELGSLVILSFFLLGITFAWETEDLEGVGIMGVLILLGTLLGGNLLSEERRLTGAEVRTAIAVSVVAVFFGIIAVQKGDSIPASDNWILHETFQNFWKVLVAVIGFYFGGLTLESITKRKAEEPTPPATPPNSP